MIGSRGGQIARFFAFLGCAAGLLANTEAERWEEPGYPDGVGADNLKGQLETAQEMIRQLEHAIADRTRELHIAVETIRRQARLVGMRTAIALVREHGTLLRAAPSMLRAFGEELGWQAVHLWMADGDGLASRVQWYAPSLLADALLAITREIDGASTGCIPNEALELARAVAMTLGPESNDPRAETARSAGLSSACAFPVVVDGHVYAVVELMSTEERPLDEDLVTSFTDLGLQIGEVVEAERTRQELRGKELQIARRIQTSILPHDLTVVGLDIAASMLTADEVGGDYYDVLPGEGGAWIGIGDVSGHGVGAGMIMIMLQSAVATLIRQVDRSPRDLVVILNELMHDAIRKRMHTDDHVTFTLLRYTADGSIRYAGAHESFLVWRAATGTCETVTPEGTWLGCMPRIDHAVFEQTLELGSGDVLVLYTDGVIETRDARRRIFGLDRLTTLVTRHAGTMTPAALLQHLTRAVLGWGTPDDDMTFVVARKR